MRRGGRLCPPAEKAAFYEKLRRIRNFPWADRVVRPYDSFENFPGTFVGVDAHIDPAIQTDFTEIPGEFDGTLGAMWASPPTSPLMLKVYFLEFM